MPMVMLLANANKSIAGGQDCMGAILLTWARALVATPYYRFAGMGDGLAALTTTPGADIFTANGGLGYKTSGAWNTAAANSFSNPLAWFRLQKLDALGLPTGKEIGVQRGSGTASGNDRFNVVAFSKAGWSGVPTASVFFPTGSYNSMWEPGPTNVFGGIGSNLTAGGGYLGSSTSLILHWNIWVPDGLSAGNIAPTFLKWDVGTTAQGFFAIEAFKHIAPADTDPFMVLGGDGNAWGAQSLAQNPTMWSTTGAPCWSWDKTGARIRCMPDKLLDFNGARPTNNTPMTSEAGNTYNVHPMGYMLATAGGANSWKGYAENLEFLLPGSASMLNQASFHALVADAVEPPRLSIGNAALPWRVGTTPLSTPGNFTTLRTALPSPAIDTTAPVIATPSPAPGAIGTTQALTVNVTDDMGLSRVIISVDYSTPDRHEKAFDGKDAVAGYDGEYDANSTVTAIAGGYAYALRPDGGWRGAFTLRITAIDQGGNVQTAAHAYTLLQSSQPSVSNISPPASSAIAANDAISFRTQDQTGILRDEVFIEFPNGQREVVWTGSAFTEGYEDSTRTIVSAGKTYDYTIRRWNLGPEPLVLGARTFGWSGAPTVIASVVDLDGNIADAAWSYTLTSDAAPQVTITPSSGSELDEGQLVQVDITDTVGLLLFFISVQYESGPPLVVWDGQQLTEGFRVNGSDTPITDGTRVIVLPDDGWIAPFILRASAIDSDGHLVQSEATFTLAAPAVIPAPMPSEGFGPEYTPRNDIVEQAQSRLLEQFRE